MKAIEFYQKLCEYIPTSLSCEWDKDGLESCPEPDRTVKKVLVALDVTDEVISKAADEGFDVILSHHPIFFGSLMGINATLPAGRRAVKLAQNSISVMSFHTRLDALDGGVNDTLAELLGLENIKTVDGDKDRIMRIGELKCEMTAEEFCISVKKSLSTADLAGGAGVALLSAGRPVKRVALIGGSGGDFVEMAATARADTYVTGDMKYHQYLSSSDYNMNLVTAGHFFTEYPVCKVLAEKASSACPEAHVEIFFSNKIVSL